MRKMIPLDDALAVVLSSASPLSSTSIGLDRAHNRIIAEAVVADRPYPPFDRSAMDGFAVRWADLRSIPANLRVVGDIPAGVWPTFEVSVGTAARIMTGAPVPRGADVVVMVEYTELSDADHVRILQAPDGVGANICKEGEDLREGELVAPVGTRVTPAVAGALGCVGCANVAVFRQPRVAVCSTGDELVGVEDAPEPQQIRDSNRYTMAAVAQEAGAIVTDLGRVADTMEALDAAIAAGLAHDVLLLSGGVSMGAYDLVSQALTRRGAELIFHKVKMKPGKPLLFARHGQTLIFGLPGNPVSTLVTAQLLVAPALLKMQGHADPRPLRLSLRTRTAIGATGSRELFLPAIWSHASGETGVERVPFNGSGDLVGFSRANCLIHRPVESPVAPIGTLVDVWIHRHGLSH